MKYEEDEQPPELGFWVPAPTKGDGHCGIHAMFGRLDDETGEYTCTSAEVKFIRNGLKVAIEGVVDLKADDPNPILPLVQAAIRELIMSAHDNPRGQLGQHAEALLLEYDDYLLNSQDLDQTVWEGFANLLRADKDVLKFISNYGGNGEQNFRTQFYTAYNLKDLPTDEKSSLSQLMQKSGLDVAFKNHKQLYADQFKWNITPELIREYATFISGDVSFLPVNYICWRILMMSH